MERTIERLIIASRWLQAPLYVGLIGVLALICVRFFSEFVHVTAALWHGEESRLVLLVLSLVDLVMVANLVIMVIISGYENFVSHIDADITTDRLSWFGKLDAGSIKIKLASSIVAISSIHLLQRFLEANTVSNDKLYVLIIMHLTFVLSALMLTYIDRLSMAKKVDAGH